MKIKVALLFLTFSFTLYAQNMRKIDSLSALLQNETRDTHRVNLLHEIAWNYKGNTPRKALTYAYQAYLISENTNHVSSRFKAMNITGLSYYNLTNYDSAQYWLNTSLEYARKQKYYKGIITALNNLGNVSADLGDNNKAVTMYIEASKLIEKNGTKLQLAGCFINIASSYDLSNAPENAMHYFELAEKILVNNKDGEIYLPVLYSNMATIYRAQNYIDKALNYFSLSVYYAEKHGVSKSVATAFDNLCVLFLKKDNLDSAEHYIKKTIEIYSSMEATGNLADAYRIYGEIEMRKNDYAKSIFYFLKAKDLWRENGSDAFSHHLFLGLSKAYDKIGDYKSAYENSLIYSRLIDSFRLAEQHSKFAEMQAQFDTEQKQKEIELLNEKDKSNKLIQYALVFGAVLLLLFALLLYNRYRLKQKANNLLEKQNTEIQEQKNVIEEKNKDITDSIKYAQRIQNAILPSPEQIKSDLSDCFVLFKPKDIVSGDFFWFDKFGDKVFFAAVDCTGHGVPGAIMSMLGYNLLNQALNEHGLSKPNLILNALNKGVSKTLRQKSADYSVNDGMDIALCALDINTLVLEYAGANNSLYVISKGELTEITADKIAIGTYDMVKNENYTNKELKLNKGDTIYIFTDGFADQFGGPKGKKFKYKQLQQVLLNNAHLPAEEQKEKLNTIFGIWKGELEQIDDVCIIGVKI